LRFTFVNGVIWYSGDQPNQAIPAQTTPLIRLRSGPKSRAMNIEAIEMQARRFSYFPRTFMWRGHRFNVCAVERCWTTGTRQRDGRVQRHYFRVRCAEGTFELFQNLIHNTWHVARFEGES